MMIHNNIIHVQVKEEPAIQFSTAHALASIVSPLLVALY